MNVYLGVLFFVVIVCLFPTKTEKEKRNKLLLALFPIFLMCGLHGDWSGDYEAYKDIFDYIKTKSFEDLPLSDVGVEAAYQYLNYILPTHLSLLLVYSLWICVFLYVFFSKFVPEKYWSVAFVVVFLCQQMLIGDISGIRNGMAVGCFIIALDRLCDEEHFKRNKLWFLAFIILGTLMHTSCVVLVFFMFLSRKQASSGSISRSIILFISFFIVTLLTPRSVIDAMDYFVNSISIFNRYAFYVEQMEDVKAAWGLSRLLVFYVAIVSLIEVRKPGYSGAEYMMIRFAFVWAVMMLIPASMIARFFFYFNYVMLAGMMIMAAKTKSQIIKWGNLISLVLYYIYHFRIFTHAEWYAEHWQNYTFFFQ